ncbi:MAG: adenylate cyclase [Luteibaculaceae bacterium]
MVVLAFFYPFFLAVPNCKFYFKRMNQNIRVLKLKDLLKTGFLGLFVVLICQVIALTDFHWGILPFGFSLGMLVGFIELVIFRRFYTDMSLPVLLIGKLIFYYIGTLLLIIVFTIIIAWGIERNGTIVDLVSEIFTPIKMLESLRVLIPVIFVVLYLQIETLVGKGMFGKYLRGAYSKPKLEERVFLFVDMIDSTSFAEKLGDRKYYRLLNGFFRMMSRPLFDSHAEIYKYVGDEVIISWKIKKNRPLDKCVNTVFNIQKQIDLEKGRYLEQFGTFPKFRASMHVGTVICAQVGDLKKEIAYNGDVLNITSRMQGVCKELRERLVVSEDVFERMEHKEKWRPQPLGKVKLKGKNEEIAIVVLKI